MGGGGGGSLQLLYNTSLTNSFILFPSSLYIVTHGNVVLYKATLTIRHLPIMWGFLCKIIVGVCVSLVYVFVFGIFPNLFIDSFIYLLLCLFYTHLFIYVYIIC